MTVQRFARLGISAFLLLAVLPNGVEAEKKECVDIKNLSELKKTLKDSDVMFALMHESQKPEGDGDDKTSTAYEELCQRYSATPSERLGNLVMGKVTVSEPGYDDEGNLKTDDNRDIAKVLVGSSKNLQSTEYFVIQKGQDLKDAVKFEAEEKTVEAISEFLSSSVPAMGKLGTWVYSIDPMDTIAAIFMEAPEDGWLRKVLAYNAKFLALSMSFRKETKPVANLYVKAFFQMLEHGSEYPEKQIKRLEKMMEKESSNLSPIQMEDMSQKVTTLQKFTKPVEVTNQLWGKFAMQLVMTASSIFLIPSFILLLFTSMFGGEEKKEDEDKAKEAKKDQ